MARASKTVDFAVDFAVEYPSQNLHFLGYPKSLPYAATFGKSQTCPTQLSKGCPKSLPYADIFIKSLPYTAAARPNFQKELKILPLRGHVARPLAKASQALAKASQDNPTRAQILTLREHFHIILRRLCARPCDAFARGLGRKQF